MRDELRAIVGERLYRARTACGLNQRDAAEAVGITQASWSNYENGKRTVPLDLAIRIQQEFELSEPLATMEDLRE